MHIMQKLLLIMIISLGFHQVKLKETISVKDCRVEDHPDIKKSSAFKLVFICFEKNDPI